MPKVNHGNLSDNGEHSFFEFLQAKDIALSYLRFIDNALIDKEDKVERINSNVYLVSRGNSLEQDSFDDDQSTLSDSMC